MTYLRRRPAGARTTRQRIGDSAEDAACLHLEQNGCRIVARNVRYREGELDVVASEGAILVFVEVRMRSRNDFGDGADSVDAFKRQRLVRAARHYLAQHFTNGGKLPPCRFDVVTADNSGVTDWIRDAFNAPD